MRSSSLLACLLCSALFGCNVTGIRPQTARIARGERYELTLESAKSGLLSNGRGTAQRIAIRVGRVAAGARPVLVAMRTAGKAPCSGGHEAFRLRLRGQEGHFERALAPGDTLEADFGDEAWEAALAAPSALDVLLVADDGSRQCAVFPLVNGEPENRWLPLERWSIAMVMHYSALTKPIDGARDLGGLDIELATFVDKLRLFASLGAGGGDCAASVCPRYRNKQTKELDERDYFYVPLAAGAEITALHYAFVALDLKLSYRIGPVSTHTYDDDSRLSLMHGPVLSPALVFTTPDPLGPGIPGGLRRGASIGFGVPVGYLWSSSGAGALSVGGAFTVQVPIH